MGDNSYIEKFFMTYPIFLILVVFVSISLIFLLKLQSFYYYITILSTVVTISALFVFFTKNLPIKLEEIYITLFDKNLLLKIYFIIFIISILYIVLTNDRSEVYISLLLLLYLVMFVQIFSNKTSSSIILIEIAASMINFIYSVTFVYPFYFGSTDILPHIRLAEIIAESGRLVPESMFLYSKFPLYHVLVAISAHVTNLDITNSLFLITAPAFIIVLLFIYMLFYLVSNNKQISLLSCLVYSWSSVILFHGTYMVTRVLAFVFFMILFYLHYRVNSTSSATNVYYKILILIFVLSIVLAHQVSAVQISFLFILFLLCEYLGHDRGYISITSFLHFNVVFISYWIYVAYHFTFNVIGKRLRELIYTDRLTVQHNASSFFQNEDLLNLLFSNLDVYISLIFALIGIKYLILNQRSKSKVAFGLFSMVCFMFYFPSPLKLLWNTMELLQFDRLTLLVFPFISLSIGIGIYIVIKSLFTNRLKTLCYLAILLIPLFFGFFSITNSNTNSNFVYYDGPRSYFTQQEIYGFNYLDKYALSESYVFSDYFSQRYLQSLTSKDYVCFAHLSPSEIKNSTYYDLHYFFIRSEAFKRGGLYFGTPNTKEIFNSWESNYQNNSLDIDMASKSKIYSNSYVNLYLDSDFSQGTD